jgi:predicted amidophosphoribosyltransferase
MPEHLNALQADYLLPVPLSAEKLMLRGFNQSWELARRIKCKDSIRKMPYILKRRHHQKPQAGSSLRIRQSNIRGTFYLKKDALTLLKNKSVIVFDDVMTSGATLDEIARILKDNGVSRVINWVLLRTSKTSFK